MSELKWVLKKNLPSNAKYVVAKDVYEFSGAKNFTYFKSFNTMCKFFDINKWTNLYQMILSIDDPVFMYFDIDVSDKNKGKEEKTILAAFIATLEKYLQEAHDIEITFVPGANCQITTASQKNKCSIHFIAYILFPSVRIHKTFTFNLCNYIIKNDIKDLTYIKLDNNTLSLRHAIDCSVYTNFRSFRMTYMSKMGCENPLLPINGSSTNAADYIITYHEGQHPRTPIHIIKDVFPTSLNQSPLQYKNRVDRRSKIKAHAIKNVANTVPSNYSKFIDFIETSPIIAEQLKLEKVEIDYIYESYDDDTSYRLYVKKKQTTKATCPFANKQHHNSNLVFCCSKLQSVVHLTCTSQHCRNKRNTFVVFDEEEKNKSFVDTLYSDTLHSINNSITWNELYDEPTMRMYPNNEFVCIRGNMGVGKTESLKHFMKKYVKDTTKVLIVTFSRSLTEKYYNDLHMYGFTSYLKEDEIDTDNISKQIEKNKVIICLDSILRIHKTEIFDYIIIDEALSVFMHMNSTLMRNPNLVCHRINKLMLSCKHLFMIDACIDHLFMYNVINYISAEKNTIPYWIYNKYIRPTNRYVELNYMSGYISSLKVSENPIIFDTVTKIHNLLSKNKRIVIASSTRSFTIMIHEIIKDIYPNKIIGIYNSDTNNESIDTSEWTKLDVLIYSPSITAGVSFTEEHFDNLVGFIINSPGTPTVDIVLQQLFRVRQLKDGGMFLYVMDQTPSCELPLTEYKIEDFLTNTETIVTKYVNEYHNLPVNAFAELTAYMKNVFSYEILKGIYTMYNRSRILFIDILKNTLEQDYNIPISYRNNESMQQPTTEYDIENIDNDTVITYSEELLVNEFKYQMLLKKQKPNIMDKIRIKIRRILIHLYGLEEKDFCKEFYDTYILPDNAYTMAEVVIRWFYGTRTKYDTLQSDLINYLTSTKQVLESNLEIYRNETMVSKSILLLGVQLMDLVTKGTSWGNDMIQFKTIQLSADEISKTYELVLNTYSEKQKRELFKILNMEETVKPVFGFRKIIKETLGLESERLSQNTKRKNYNQITVKTSKYIEDLFTKYTPNIDKVLVFDEQKYSSLMDELLINEIEFENTPC